MKTKKKILSEILFKMANGFEYTETVEEYAPDKTEGAKETLVLVKKKVTKHYIPPDMLAIKMLIEDSGQKIDKLSSMTDEELVALKNKLISEIVGGDTSATN